VYSFRLVFIVFFGECQHPVKEYGGLNMSLPLIVLAAGALLAGYFHIPVDSVFARGAEAHEEHHVSILMHGIMILVPIIGVGVAYFSFLRRSIPVAKWAESGFGAALHRFWFNGWGMDWLYQRTIVNPFLFLARINRRDLIDGFYSLLSLLVVTANAMLVKTQTGQIRWYAITFVGGLVILVLAGAIL